MNDLRVLGIHGVGNLQPSLAPGPAARRIADWWLKALAKRLGSTALTVEMAYYAHLLSSAENLPQGEEELDLLPQWAQDDALIWGRLLGAGDDIAQGRLSAPLRALVDWIARTYGLDHRLARMFIVLFFAEVNAYFTDSDRRGAAVTEVADALERVEPRVVVAHSLGSVVAYEALWTSPHPEIELFLTLGSPLAMPDVVYDRLLPHEGARRLPPGVARWINIADPGDIVAVPRGGIAAGFQQVTADITDGIGAFDFHRATKYLACAATAGVLAAHM